MAAQLHLTERMVADFLDQWLAGIEESRFFAMALFDLLLHSSAPPYTFDGKKNLDIAALYRAVLEKHQNAFLRAGLG